MRNIVVSAVAVSLLGCATRQIDPNFMLQMEAYKEHQRALIAIAQARESTERARFAALGEFAARGDVQARGLAVIALAMSGAVGQGGVATPYGVPVSMPLPTIPEAPEDKALKWAALFAGPVANLAVGYFGYRLGQNANNNATSVAQSTNETFAALATAGFGTNERIATTGFQTTAGMASNAFTSMDTIASRIQAPPSSITLGGSGIVNGNATSSFNTTRNCTSGTAVSGAAPTGATSPGNSGNPLTGGANC